VVKSYTQSHNFYGWPHFWSKKVFIINCKTMKSIRKIFGVFGNTSKPRNMVFEENILKKCKFIFLVFFLFYSCEKETILVPTEEPDLTNPNEVQPGEFTVCLIKIIKTNKLWMLSLCFHLSFVWQWLLSLSFGATINANWNKEFRYIVDTGSVQAKDKATYTGRGWSFDNALGDFVNGTTKLSEVSYQLSEKLKTKNWKLITISYLCVVIFKTEGYGKGIGSNVSTRVQEISCIQASR